MGGGERVDPDELLRARWRRSVGHLVSFRRLAMNSLLVYIDGTPGSGTGITFWLEPPWHLRGPDGGLTCSGEAGYDDEAREPEAGFRRAAAALDVLVGRTLVDVRVEPTTGDLLLEFDGEHFLRTIASDPDDDELWHVRDNTTATRVVRSARGYAVTSDG